VSLVFLLPIFQLVCLEVVQQLLEVLTFADLLVLDEFGQFNIGVVRKFDICLVKVSMDLTTLRAEQEVPARGELVLLLGNADKGDEHV